MKRLFLLICLGLVFCAQESMSSPTSLGSQGGLMSEFQALDKSRNKTYGRAQSAEFIRDLKSFRAKVDEYTRKHSGEELNLEEWGIPFQVCYEWSDKYGCMKYEQAEELIRHGLNLLSQSKPADWRLPHRIAIHLAAMHGHRWMEKQPMECASLLDEIEPGIMSTGDRELIRYWHFMIPTVDVGLLYFAYNLPLKEGRNLYKCREKKLKACLANETVPLSSRTRYVSMWADHLYRKGKVKKADRLLNRWWTEHGKQIVSADYYSSFMWVALFGNGSWKSARTILDSTTELQKQWKKPSDRRRFASIVKVYYDNIFIPGYELKRKRHADLKKQMMKEQNKDTKKHQ